MYILFECIDCFQVKIKYNSKVLAGQRYAQHVQGPAKDDSMVERKHTLNKLVRHGTTRFKKGTDHTVVVSN